MQLLKRQLDATTLALFDEHIHFLSECRSAPSHYRMLTTILEQTLQTNTTGKPTDVVNALHEIAEKMHRRSLIILFSDMVQEQDSDRLFAALQHLRYNKHEVLLFHLIEGSKELRFEYENRPYEFVDMETGEKIKLQPNQIKETYVTEMTAFLECIKQRCHQYKIDYESIDLSTPVEPILYRYLVKRNKMQ